jgi:hypothetical protein
MKISKIICAGVAGIFLFFLVSAALAQDVNTDYDKDFDFKTIKTFVTKIGTSWGNPLSEKRVTGDIESALMSKGWTKATDEASADAIVMIHGATEQKKDLNTFYSGYGGYGYRWGGGMGTAHTSVNEYTVGTLVVDIFDSKSKQLVFRGVAQDEISEKAEKNAKKMKKVKEKMFKDFPPRTKSK